MKKALSILMILCILFVTVQAAMLSAAAENISYPRVEITTVDQNGNSLQKADGYVDASVSITDTDGSVLTDAVVFKVRGNSTALAAKKGFTFKFSKKKNVLGLGKGKKWALLANAYDPTLLRNAIAFDLADELEMQYTSQRRFVELWVDGVYKGCYQLMEPVQEGSDRVAIDIESNGGMKDFLLEYEAVRYESDVTYISIDGLRFAINEPEEPNADQLSYIRGIMSDIISTVKNGDQDAIAQAIDVNSFAAYYLLNEYLKTLDFGFSSVFFYYQDGKLYAGPPWDYDLSLGNASATYSATSIAAHQSDGLFANDKQIFATLTQYSWFIDEVKKLYTLHQDFFDDIAADGGLIDRLYAENAELIRKNEEEAGWKTSAYQVNVQMRPLATYAENYAFLKNWCSERNDFLYDYFSPLSPSYLLGDIDQDHEVTVFDATYIQRYLANFSSDIELIKSYGDVDDSGDLEIFDVTFIQRWLAKYNDPYPIGTRILL